MKLNWKLKDSTIYETGQDKIPNTYEVVLGKDRLFLYKNLYDGEWVFSANDLGIYGVDVGKQLHDAKNAAEKIVSERVRDLVSSFLGKKVPKQKPGESKQDYETPWALIGFINKTFPVIEVDLASREDNKKADNCYTPEQNSLIQNWSQEYRTGFLNPEFGKIGPWARKCAEEGQKGMNIYLLVPASVGANWFVEDVMPYATTYLLSERVPFAGWDLPPFPKDCMLCIFGPLAEPLKIETLSWISKEDAAKLRKDAKEIAKIRNSTDSGIHELGLEGEGGSQGQGEDIAKRTADKGTEKHQGPDQAPEEGE